MNQPSEGLSGTLYYDQVCLFDLSLLWYVVMHNTKMLTICLNGQEFLAYYDSIESCEAAYHAMIEAKKYIVTLDYGGPGMAGQVTEIKR